MAEQTVTDVERQLVVFDLANERYGVDIGTVREIIRMQEITHVPNSPDYVDGVTNLRGKVIPVVNLRRLFGLEPGEETNDTRVVVIEIEGEDIGVRVDAVAEVLRIAESSVEQETSAVVTTMDSDYMQGIANPGQGLIILLDLAKALSVDDIAAQRASKSKLQELKKSSAPKAKKPAAKKKLAAKKLKEAAA
ncbi:MAG: chemotaxis protein CheW [Chloroflexi bacterium]|nr:chemotaxis protein CheW [Chloroflexota bacterium]